ncbi:hypothetical protein [Pelagicoccus mobilis]|uniref:Uncharacterized protein n=1 Tax=Pelagicoccus mobilis TaxID=415221 RepID=A0A934RYW4_9BACT|nr:hypothetical protein [Pelagicoccus mobilis]MBK1877814.1 hypothetical protein [Pelagicoccus mobilis]
MARQKREHANYFSTIIQVDRSIKKATLTHNNQLLTNNPNNKIDTLLALLETVDSWHQRMRTDPSVTQSDIAKNEDISRSRVAQLLQLALLPTELKRQVESSKIQSVNQLRKRLRERRFSAKKLHEH